jgi:hypothetical protein
VRLLFTAGYRIRIFVAALCEYPLGQKNLLLRTLKWSSMRRALIILFVVLAWTGLYVGPALALLASITPACRSVLLTTPA